MNFKLLSSIALVGSLMLNPAHAEECVGEACPPPENCDGSGPTGPGDGSGPADPGDGAPTDPGDGSGPADPGDGSGPADPGDGSGPADPGDGSGPADPGDGSGSGDDCPPPPPLPFAAATVNVSTTESSDIIIGDDNTEVLYSSSGPLTPVLAIVTQPAKGTASLTNNLFTFSPNGEFDALNDGESEQVTIAYSVADTSDLTATAPGSIIVTVNGETDLNATTMSLATAINESVAFDGVLNAGEIIQLNIYVSNLPAGQKVELSDLQEGLSVVGAQSAFGKSSTNTENVTGSVLTQSDNTFISEASESTGLWLQVQLMVAAETAVGELQAVTVKALDASDNTVVEKSINLPAVSKQGLVATLANMLPGKRAYVLRINTGAISATTAQNWVINLSEESDTSSLNCTSVALNTNDSSVFSGELSAKCNEQGIELSLQGAELEENSLVEIVFELPQLTARKDLDWAIAGNLTQVESTALNFSSKGSLLAEPMKVAMTKQEALVDGKYVIEVALADIIKDTNLPVFLELTAGTARFEDKFICDTKKIAEKFSDHEGISIDCSDKKITLSLSAALIATLEGDSGVLFTTSVEHNDIETGNHSGSKEIFHYQSTVTLSDQYVTRSISEVVLISNARDSLGLFAALLAIFAFLFYQRRKNIA